MTKEHLVTDASPGSKEIITNSKEQDPEQVPKKRFVSSSDLGKITETKKLSLGELLAAGSVTKTAIRIPKQGGGTESFSLGFSYPSLVANASKLPGGSLLLTLLAILGIGGGVYEYKNPLTAPIGIFYNEEKEASQCLEVARKTFDLKNAIIAKVYGKNENDKRKDFLFLVVRSEQEGLIVIKKSDSKFTYQRLELTEDSVTAKEQIKAKFGQSADSSVSREIVFIND